MFFLHHFVVIAYSSHIYLAYSLVSKNLAVKLFARL